MADNESSHLMWIIIVIAIAALIFGGLKVAFPSLIGDALNKMSQGVDGVTMPVTHTAYAFSPDGTDRFSIVKPNSDLLSGTSKYTESNPYVVTGTSKDIIALAKDLYVENLQPGTYTLSAKTDGVWVSHSTSIVGIPPSAKATGLWLCGVQSITDTSSNGINFTMGATVPNTLTVTKAGTYMVRFNAYSNGTDSVTRKFWDVKLTQGLVDAPYIGTYTDSLDVGSTDPSKYTWKKVN